MLKYIGDLSEDLTKYGFKKVNDYEVAYIKRDNDKGNAFIDINGYCVSIRNKEAFEPLIKEGLVIKEG